MKRQRDLVARWFGRNKQTKRKRDRVRNPSFWFSLLAVTNQMSWRTLVQTLNLSWATWYQKTGEREREREKQRHSSHRLSPTSQMSWEEDSLYLLLSTLTSVYVIYSFIPSSFLFSLLYFLFLLLFYFLSLSLSLSLSHTESLLLLLSLPLSLLFTISINHRYSDTSSVRQSDFCKREGKKKATGTGRRRRKEEGRGGGRRGRRRWRRKGEKRRRMQPALSHTSAHKCNMNQLDLSPQARTRNFGAIF